MYEMVVKKAEIQHRANSARSRFAAWPKHVMIEGIIPSWGAPMLPVRRLVSQHLTLRFMRLVVSFYWLVSLVILMDP